MNKEGKLYRYINKALTFAINISIVVFPPLYIPLIFHIAKDRGNRILRLRPISIRKYCADQGEKIRIIEGKQSRIVYESPYYPDLNGNEYNFNSPEIYLAELSDVTVHGGTGLIISDKYALTDVCENDIENRVQYSCGPIRKGSKRSFFVEVSEDVEEINTAISLCGLAASNYYHLTFEILSRYGYLRGTEYAENITVLLDDAAAIYPQFVDLTHTVLGNASIKYIKEYDRIHCKKLIYPSMNTWMPMNVRKKNDFRISDNVLALSAIDNIRRASEEYRLKRTDKKIFISRKHSSFSRIINEKEVEKLFVDNGYEIIYTEKLSYKEQVELFSAATCIVGATGAAFTNLVYCNPGAVFGCIMPKKYEFCIYSSIAHMVGCKCLFLDAKTENNGTAISNEQYRVDMEDCKGYIAALGKLI